MNFRRISEGGGVSFLKKKNLAEFCIKKGGIRNWSMILILEHSWVFNNYLIIKFETLKRYSRNLLEKSEEGDWTQTISKGCSHLLSCSQKMNFLSSCHHLVNLLACLVSRWFFWDFTVNQSNGYTHNTKVWFWPSPMTEFEASKNLLCI